MKDRPTKSRDLSGKFISKARAGVGSGKDVLKMRGSLASVSRRKELSEKRKERRGSLQALIRR